MLAGSTMNTFAEPLENIFRINKREGQPTGLAPYVTIPCIASERLAMLITRSLWTLWTAVRRSDWRDGEANRRAYTIGQ